MPKVDPPPPRAHRWQRLDEAAPTVCVVGGGATGASVALDLALRGVSVALLEQGDWAGATSSSSSRLLHGGLRYLEAGEVGLVRESCRERGLFLRNAAGLAWPERFVFPVQRGDRVGLTRLGAGLALYSLLSLPRALGLPRLSGRQQVASWIPGINRARLRGGGVYQDGATDDARLVLSVVRTAMSAGATCLSRAQVLSVDSSRTSSELIVRDLLSGEERRLQARAIVLCGGPFTDQLRARAGLGDGWTAPTRGAHVLVPRDRLPTDGAVIFPSCIDGRVMFLIPWPRYTVIGTTDLDADPSQPVQATRAEVNYLLDSANGLVPPAELGEADVVSTYAGLRPLLAAGEANPSARSREERVVQEGPLWTVAGGKLTGMRAMAESLCARLVKTLPEGASGTRSPTRGQRLIGSFDRPVGRPSWSTPGADERSALAIAWERRYAALEPGVRAMTQASSEGQRPLDEETLLGELDWAVEHEDCLFPEDFFLRRTDLGLGPREDLAEARELVLARMEALRSWSPPERERAALSLEDALGRAHAWRSEADPSD